MGKIYFVLFIFATFWMNKVNCDCSLNIRGNSPLFVKNFGSRKIILKKQVSNIPLEDGEIIQAYCSTRIVLSNLNHNSLKSIELQCLNQNIQYRNENAGTFTGYIGHGPQIYCGDEFVPVLYESRRTLPNCKDYVSYAIGIAPQNIKEIISAGICYDLDTLTMKYVTYLAYHSKYDFITQKETNVDLQVDLNKKISNFDSYFSFMSPLQFRAAVDSKKTYNLLYNFDLMSIIQDEPLRSELSNFDNIFNIVWWNGLRLGNWKLYLEALAERTKTIRYVISMGTSGTIALPTTSCNKTEIMTIEANEITVQAPNYVWAKIESLPENKNESFVVIGYNSPFYKSPESDIFCEDMCDEIDWLKTSLFGRVRLMPGFGVVFCCRPEEVAEKFQNFPLTQLKPTTTAAPELNI